MMQWRNVWLVTGWLLVSLVIYLSLMPMPPTPVSFEYSDKIEHMLAYAMLSLWFCQVYPSVRARWIVVVGLIGLGIGIEYAQRWTGYRQFEVQDMFADGMGVSLGWLLVFTPLGRVHEYIESYLKAR